MRGMFPLIEVAGDPLERGRQHGARARERVGRSLANYRRLFEHYGLGWDEAQRRARPYRDAIGALGAGYLDELRGIAEGARRGGDEILALNVRTEIIPAEFISGHDAGECTAIAVAAQASATGGTLLAQNWDWLGEQRDSLIQLRYRAASGLACMTLTEAGMLAKIGLNSAGFGICLNILRSRRDGERPAVPVHVLLRALLERADVRDAIGFASKLRFAGSSNVLCADKSGDAAALECSPLGLRVVRGGGTTLCHTNHFIDPEARGLQVELAPHLSTEQRLETAERHAAARTAHGLEDLKRLLRDETAGYGSICRSPDPSQSEFSRIETVASVVMELARGVMHVAPDVPSRTEYQPVGLASEGEIALA